MARKQKQRHVPGSELSRKEQERRKQRVLTAKTPSIAEDIGEAIVIKDHALFFLSRPNGEVPLEGATHHGFGLYYRDCRYLNGYELRLEGRCPNVLGTTVPGGFKAELQLTNPRLEPEDACAIERDQLGIRWERLADCEDYALHEILSLKNHGMTPARFMLRLKFQAAFEDLFAIRGLLREQQGRCRPPQWHGPVLGFLYEGADDRYRSLSVGFKPAPDETREAEAIYHLDLAPQAETRLVITLGVRESEHPREAQPHALTVPDLERLSEEFEQRTEEWVSRGLRIDTDSMLLDRIIQRAFRDLYALRSVHDGLHYFAAGVPWFVTLFGRDSLMSAMQVLPFDGETTRETLRLLARYQGERDDFWRDEAPGKILHELRVGELAALGEIPHTPYYGTVDATMLFLIAVAEHVRWKGDLGLFDELREPIDRALAWMDRVGDGYFTYDSAVSERLVNQAWKDAGDAVVNADGSLGRPPLALVEVQGYAYMAWRGMARLFAHRGDHERAQTLEDQAARLKARFNRDFWLEDLGFYALALQKDGEPCAVVSSNPAHALWTGIVDDDKAERVVKRVMQDDMFSGWGVRTLSTREVRYNPVGYHLGTVWPHDNAIIAAGCRRYGRLAAAEEIFDAIIDAASYFPENQLPELFSGFPRQAYGAPIHFPVACHPQAWAAGAVPQLLTMLLGLEPDALSRKLRIVKPLLPRMVDFLILKGLGVGEASVDLRFERRGDEVGVEVIRVEGELDVSVA